MDARILVLAVAGATVFAPARLQAQATGRGGGAAVAGVVSDVHTERPLPHALVLLTPEPAGVVTDPVGSLFRVEGWSVQADRDGRYRFSALAPGRYRVQASGVGYRSYAVTVELQAGTEVGLSLGLTPESVDLEPMDVRVARPAGYHRTHVAPERSGVPARGGLAPVRVTHPVDAYELTQRDVMQAVTLGEPDLFRALQRLPGISTRSDYTAELWTRGASWAETRVYYDGVPVLNPLHGLGSFSAVHPGAVGTVWVYTGARPASLGEGAAAAVDIRSRAAEGSGELRGAADISLVSSAATLSQRVSDDFGWSLTARRSYLDWLIDAARQLDDDRVSSFPYAFWDVSGRVDADVPVLGALEASGLWQEDRFERQRDEPAAAWGNRVARLTHRGARGGLHVRHTIGGSVHRTVVEDSSGQIVSEIPFEFPAATRGRVSHVAASGEWSRPEPTGIEARWTAGYELGFREAYSEGIATLPLPRLGEEDTVALAASDTISGSLVVVSLWADRRWTPTERLSLRIGARVESGQPITATPAIRVAPRVTARWAAATHLALTASLARNHQYLQALVPSGVRRGSMTAGHVWLLAGDEVRAVIGDVASLGLEVWLPDGWTAGASAYARRASPMAVPDPAPGPVHGRRPFVLGENVAAGVELSAKRIGIGWSSTFAYTAAVSTMEVEGRRYPAPADRRHVADATLLFELGGGWRGGSAITAASGVAYTVIDQGVAPCAGEPGTCEPDTVARFGTPHGARSPAFSSLDLLLDWDGELLGLAAGAFIQLRNALGRSNETRYIGARGGCERHYCGPAALLENRAEPGLPRLPVVGLRVRF